MWCYHVSRYNYDLWKTVWGSEWIIPIISMWMNLMKKLWKDVALRRIITKVTYTRASRDFSQEQNLRNGRWKCCDQTCRPPKWQSKEKIKPFIERREYVAQLSASNNLTLNGGKFSLFLSFRFSYAIFQWLWHRDSTAREHGNDDIQTHLRTYRNNSVNYRCIS